MADRQIIVAEAPTLEEARERLQEQLDDGLMVIQEWVTSHEDIKTITGRGETVEEAMEDGKARLPEGAKMLEIRETVEPARRTLEAWAESEERARRKVFPEFLERIESVKLKKRGGRRFLVGRKNPNVYEVILFKQATANIRYHPMARIEAQVYPIPEGDCSTLRSKFWNGKTPIEMEYIYDEEKAALLQMQRLKRDGDAEAKQEIDAIIRAAKATLMSVHEFYRYHGYEHQRASAHILGLVGDESCIPALLEARSFQDEHAGCSQYSNKSNTARLVKESIDYALSQLGYKSS